MNEDLLQRCEVCNKKMVTMRYTQKTCSKRCAGTLGGRKRNSRKGFGSLPKEQFLILGKKSGAARRKRENT